LSSIRRQFKNIFKGIRYNIDALSAAGLVKTTMTTSEKGNEGVFRVFNKTIQINNLLVNNKWNRKMVPILKDFLKFIKRILGGNTPIEETDIDAETAQALSDVMGLHKKAYEELEKVN
jgi:hypothetical protein